MKQFEYNNQLITFQIGKGVMVNATEMAKPFNKSVKDWTRLQSAEEFLSVLKSIKGHNSLLEVTKGSSNPGTMRTLRRQSQSVVGQAT